MELDKPTARRGKIQEGSQYDGQYWDKLNLAYNLWLVATNGSRLPTSCRRCWIIDVMMLPWRMPTRQASLFLRSSIIPRAWTGLIRAFTTSNASRVGLHDLDS